MPTYKVEELEGDLLDAAVAKAEGVRYMIDASLGGCYTRRGIPADWKCWSPRRWWEQGGPIKERERIGTMFIPATEVCDDLPGLWAAESPLGTPEPSPRMCSGRTELEAAMRMRVRMKFGDTVDLS